MSPTMHRRTVLGAGAAIALGVATGALTGCGPDAATNVGNTGAELTPWPDHVEFAGPPADLPASSDGVQNAYISYPDNVVTSVPDTPGDGSTVRAMFITYSAPPAALADSPRWQAVNKALGIDLQVTVVPDAQFAEKMATVLASNDLPDIIMLGAGYSLPREAEFVASKCVDLSDLLSGDKIKAYPNLANIPTYAWQAMGRTGGKIYGIPIERPVFGNSLLANRSQLDSVNAPRKWSADDFRTAMTSLTTSRTWGTAVAREALGGSHLEYHAGSFGAPNRWAVANGAFTSTYVTEQYKESIAFTAELWKKKVYYPDSPTSSQVDLETLVSNETLATLTDGFGTFAALVNGAEKKFTLDFALPYGTNPTPWRGTGIFGYTVFPNAAPERIEMLLRVCNYLAAPFGTKEYELNVFGIEGTDFTRSTGAVTLKTDGNPPPPPFRYIAAPPGVINFPGLEEATRRLHQWQSDIAPLAVANPGNGLRSQTLNDSGVKLQTMLTDAAGDIMLGRADLSDWDAVVAKWRSEGGDKIAEELAEEHATNA